MSKVRARERARRRQPRPLRAAAALLAVSLLLGAVLTPGEGERSPPPPVVVPDAAPVVPAPEVRVPVVPAPDVPAPERVPARAYPPAGPEHALAARPSLPDLRVLEPSGLYLVDETASGGARRLKFTTTIWNAGPGPLEVRGHEDPATGELVVYQTLHTPSGDVVPGDQVGTFQFDHRHGHLHLAAFARYELWSLTEDGELDQVVARNDKVGFCLMDNVVVDEELVDETRGVYPVDCRGDVQGISPGYGDVYVAQLYEQDLVIDGLPDGRYALVNVANPDGAVAEASTENNAAMVYVRLSAGSVWAE